MAISQGLRRLLHVLAVEEDQCKARMESVLAELRKLEAALAAVETRGREGRRLVQSSVMTGEVADRLAGLEESRAAGRAAVSLGSRIAETKATAAARRREFLEKRTERRQAETVIRNAEAAEAIETRRRGQREQDDWFLAKARRAEGADRASNAAGSSVRQSREDGQNLSEKLHAESGDS
jgi:hypothetical protein